MRKEILETIKLLVEKIKKRYKKQVNARRCGVEYEVGKKLLRDCKQLHYAQ